MRSVDVLDEHFLDGGSGEIGIERLPAEGDEAVEGLGEDFVRLFLRADDRGHLPADLGQLVLELGDSFFPFVKGRGLILEEAFEDGDEVVRFRDVEVERLFPVLHEHGACRGLEEDVVARVAELEFLGDLFVEIVGGVLGLPQAVQEAEAVEQRAVGRDLRAGPGLERILGDELPLVGATFVDQRGAVLQQGLKRRAHGGLVLHAQLGEIRERGVVRRKPLVIYLEGKCPHVCALTLADLLDGGEKFATIPPAAALRVPSPRRDFAHGLRGLPGFIGRKQSCFSSHPSC